jgi:hypothetical protein
MSCRTFRKHDREPFVWESCLFMGYPGPLKGQKVEKVGGGGEEIFTFVERATVELVQNI